MISYQAKDRWRMESFASGRLKIEKSEEAKGSKWTDGS